MTTADTWADVAELAGLDRGATRAQIMEALRTTEDCLTDIAKAVGLGEGSPATAVAVRVRELLADDEPGIGLTSRVEELERERALDREAWRRIIAACASVPTDEVSLQGVTMRTVVERVELLASSVAREREQAANGARAMAHDQLLALVELAALPGPLPSPQATMRELAGHLHDRIVGLRERAAATDGVTASTLAGLAARLLPSIARPANGTPEAAVWDDRVKVVRLVLDGMGGS